MKRKIWECRYSAGAILRETTYKAEASQTQVLTRELEVKTGCRKSWRGKELLFKVYGLNNYREQRYQEEERKKRE